MPDCTQLRGDAQGLSCTPVQPSTEDWVHPAEFNKGII
jgi:hypothetical protein